MKDQNKNNKSILFKFRNKFINAAKGFVVALREESTLVVHLIVTIVVIGLGIWLQLNYVQWAILALTIGIVIGFELINTMVENFVDLVSFEYNIKAKKIKDICAAASLFNSLISVVVGLLIILPPLVERIEMYVK